MENILWTIGAITFFFVCLGIRIILLKDGKFRGSCSSQNVTDDGSCSICGRTDPSGCENAQNDEEENVTQSKSTSEVK